MGVGYYGEQNVSLRTERMIVLRERARLTQVGLAVRIGITQEAISGYESGKFQPSLKNLAAIAIGLGTTTDYLLGLNEEENSNSGSLYSMKIAEDPACEYGSKDSNFSANLEKMLDIFTKMNNEQQEKTMEYMKNLLNE